MSRLLYCVLMSVVSVTVLYGFAYPLYGGTGVFFSPEKSISVLSSEKMSYSLALNDAESIMQSAKSLSNDYATVDVTGKIRMEQMVPRSIDPVRLLSEIDGIISLSGFQSDGLAYSKQDQASGGVGAYMITFTVAGDYQQFKKLINNLETSLRLINIKNITFKADSENRAKTIYQVKLTTYYKS